MSLLIDALDVTLQELLVRNVSLLRSGNPPAVNPSQVSFQPPDQDWRGRVRSLGRRALNVYLVDLRENRRLRSNETVSRTSNGDVLETPAPMQLDCYYLLTAWSPATDLSVRAVDEHALLSEVLTLLADLPTLNARDVFTDTYVPSGFPSELADADLPMSVTPVEGFGKLAEFWGTMLGPLHPWKPVTYLVVTVPVVHGEVRTGAEVTTVSTEYRQVGSAESAETVLMIAGIVRDRAVSPPEPVFRAWVQLEDSAGSPIATTWTNELGEFLFVDVVPGSYQLTTQAPGRTTSHAPSVTVPSPNGRYDLEFV